VYIQPHVDLNVRNNQTHTPLHCAIIGGYVSIIEALVGYGADVNAADLEGNTALHILLIKKAAKPLSEELTPHIIKVSIRVCV
jgi:ankyrin repeat protein